jgi:hypothetical protein
MAKGLKLKTVKVVQPIQVGEVEAYGDKRFFVSDGQILSKISDIPAALNTMSDDTFSYHVNGERNDFANWISSVFLNGDLSKKIVKSKDRKAMASALSKALVA